MTKLLACLRLMRPANVVTALADILAGFCVVGVGFIHIYPHELTSTLISLLLLLLSVAALYAGGVVFNDVFDAKLDLIERPERSIPRGHITVKQAAILASILSIIGIILACLVSLASGLIAIAIVILSIIYDAYLKHSVWLGPINMGLCRSGSLMLGVSILPEQLANYWHLMFIPLCYIAGVTFISKGEVQVSARKLLWIALVLYIITVLLIVTLTSTLSFNLWHALPFLFVFALLAFASLINALITLTPNSLRKAVKIGILSLILLDAAIAAGYASWEYGLMIILLLPISILLAKTFAVT